jgi:CheY-like chemotaxis protein
VQADAQRLKQVLINLLVNAIKYNREGGEVRLDVRPEGDDRVRIAVADTGFGIDAALLPRLFTPFERLGAERLGIEGTGLGLALSRELVEAMGGTIGVETVPGAGSTFWVDLSSREPVAAAPIAEPGHPRLAERVYAAPRTLLYIEDTVANIRLIEAILLMRPSVHLIGAMLGRLGLELAHEHQPDLILLDLHLPDVGGVEVLHRLRADDTTRGIPVVVLTADATRQDEKALRDAGARAFLTKPIEVIELLAILDEVLESE